MDRDGGVLGNGAAATPLVVTPRQAAKMLGCAQNTVYWLIGQGRLRAIRLSDGPKAGIRIPLKALHEFIDSASN